MKKNTKYFDTEDILLKINGQEVEDIIDLRFYSDTKNSVIFLHKDQEFEKFIDIKELKKLEFFEDIPDVKTCNNSCLFCFINQLPKNLRKSLYFKDDDWRLSFLCGNFITLTNLEEHDIKRIVKQRISPLYVSIHATDDRVRKLLVKSKIKDNAFNNLKHIDSCGINTNLQIVLCPGINDGPILEKTLKDLEKLKNVKSVGLVPVGITRFHKNNLKPYTNKLSADLIKYIEKKQKKYHKQKKIAWVYLADEFYLMASQDIPSKKYYDDFDQLENGIGLTRQFLDGIKNIEDKKVLLLTGVLFFKTLEKIFENKPNIMVQAIENNFLGTKITVAGLISAQDIIKQVKPADYPILIPDIMVDDKGFFLDDVGFSEVKKSLPTAELVPSSGFEFSSWLKKL